MICIECLNPQVPRIRRDSFDHPIWGIARSGTLSQNSNFDHPTGRCAEMESIGCLLCTARHQYRWDSNGTRIGYYL